MSCSERETSEVIVRTVADVLGKDPLDLPPLEATISSDALNTLFHPSNPLSGAYTLFPYCDLWVAVHSSGTVNVFERYVGTTIEEDLPEPVSQPLNDERLAIVHFDGEVYTFYRNDLDELDDVVKNADDCEDAWERAIRYAHNV